MQGRTVMEAELLEVCDLKVWYNTRRQGKLQTVKAVDGVSFKLIEGKTTGLVGESGSGKSTIGRSLVRLAPITAGSLFYRGVSIGELNERAFAGIRKKIQMIFQDPYHSLNPRMTVAAMLEEPMKLHFPQWNAERRRSRSRELLDQVGLPETSLTRYPHQFSGGQRQRLGIARAMTVEPEILICDEAVSALDVSVQAQIINLLQDLQEQYGFTYLFIGHDLAVVEHISDQVLVMQHGRIVESGTPDAIYANPQHAYTRRLLEAVPKLQW